MAPSICWILTLPDDHTGPIIDGIRVGIADAATATAAAAVLVALDPRLPADYFTGASEVQIVTEDGVTSYQGGLFGQEIANAGVA